MRPLRSDIKACDFFNCEARHPNQTNLVPIMMQIGCICKPSPGLTLALSHSTLCFLLPPQKCYPHPVVVGFAPLLPVWLHPLAGGFPSPLTVALLRLRP